MDEIVLLLLIAAGVFFLPLVLAIVALSKTGRLERDIFKLKNELRLLREEGIVPPPAQAASSAPQEQITQAPEPAEVGLQPTPSGEAEPQPEPVPEPKAARASLEESLTGRWFVWIGAVAIALAGLFLVKYMADYGLLGPGPRVVLGIVAGVALTLAGEWLRRRPSQQKFAALQPDYVPQALSSGGLAAVFASIFAASSLYGFIGPAATLIALAVTALAAFALSVVQGPLTAIVGLLGGFALPALMGSDDPFAPGLFGYFAVLVVAVCAVMVWRPVLWLAAAAIGLSAFWVVFWMIQPFDSNDTLTLGLFIALLGSGFAFAGGQISRGSLPALWHKPLGKGGADLNAAAIGGLAAAVLALMNSSHAGYGNGAVICLTVLVGAMVFAALRAQRFDFLVLLGGLTAVLMFSAWGAHLHIVGLLADWLKPSSSPWAAGAPEEARRYLVGSAVFGAAFAVGGHVLLSRGVRPWVWAVAGTAVPIGLMIAAYATLRSLEPALKWSIAGLVLSALFVGFAARVRAAAENNEPMRLVLGIYAVATCAALAMALSFVLRDAWLSASLAVLVLAMAQVSGRLQLPQLYWPALVLAVAVVIRLSLNHHILDYDETAWLGRWWVVYGYALPLVMFHLALNVFRTTQAGAGHSLLLKVLEGGRIALAAMLVSALIRTAVAGSLEADDFTLFEAGLHATSWLVSAAACWWRYTQSGGQIDLWGGRLLTALGGALVVLCLISGLNPVFDRQYVGEWPVFNALTPAYLLPALLIAAISYVTRNLPMPKLLSLGAPAAALVLALVWLSMEVRRWFHAPENMHTVYVSTAETYSYSAAWLAFALALLAAGIFLRQAPLRHGGLAVMVLAVAKVFLIDMGDLEGLLRVASFLGLGLCLVGIGFVYQRFVLQPKPHAENTAD